MEKTEQEQIPEDNKERRTATMWMDKYTQTKPWWFDNVTTPPLEHAGTQLKKTVKYIWFISILFQQTFRIKKRI